MVYADGIFCAVAKYIPYNLPHDYGALAYFLYRPIVYRIQGKGSFQGSQILPIAVRANGQPVFCSWDLKTF
jgi:hypothetical protein